MNFQENIRIALRALAANKLRSGLTMLGIIIGVGAVVALMSIGNGAMADITNQVQGIGSNLVTVIPGRFQPGRPPTSAFLYYADYEALAKNMKNVTDIVPSFQRTMTVTYGSSTQELATIATSSRFWVVRSYEVEAGRFITESDRATRGRVAVIGAQTSKDFFGGLSPIGREIKVSGVGFEVVGMLKEKGSSGFGPNPDAVVIVPLETGYDKLFGSAAVIGGKLRVTDVSMSAESPDVVEEVMVQAERILRRQRGKSLTDLLDFTVLSQAAFLGILNAITATLTAFLGFIAGISLLVGGIGIMNIMLVSVTERTREIGLRKAVGATRMSILIQFLIETLVLSLLGGSIGIFLGWSTAMIVRLMDLVKAEVSLDSVLLAFGLSAAVGIFFGLYPAFRASRLQPIEALRYE
ncbi:MAG: ABC transporter permease [Chloroflexota bacterium]